LDVYADGVCYWELESRSEILVTGPGGEDRKL